jgi:hypothetical protein
MKVKPAQLTLRQARERRRELEVECSRIQTQLDDPLRFAKYSDSYLYDKWKGLAREAKRNLEREIAWLSRIVEDETGLELLREARDMLRRLREDEVEFDSDELELLERVELFLKEKEG